MNAKEEDYTAGDMDISPRDQLRRAMPDALSGDGLSIAKGICLISLASAVRLLQGDEALLLGAASIAGYIASAAVQAGNLSAGQEKALCAAGRDPGPHGVRLAKNGLFKLVSF